MKKIFTVMFTVFSIMAYSQNNKIEQTDSTVTFMVSGNCSMCKARIEDAAKSRGVKSGTWDVDTKVFTLQYNPAITNPLKVQEKIAYAGHDTELKNAKDNVYQELPECCLYRDNFEKGTLANEIVGVVMEIDAKGNLKPLTGASIMIEGKENAVLTSENGFFKLSTENKEAFVEISYVGFKPVITKIETGQHVTIVLNEAKQLQEVKIVSKKRTSFISNASVIRTEMITEKELFKAACCNLSESFETNPSVDVSYADAVTGSKQIQMLGLSGNYSQLTVENLPGPRGLSTAQGLNYIPGTWVESIQLTKGVGSVANGFESITGQINVELKKPENAEQLYANVYVNNMGKTDINLNLSKKLGNKWSTALLLHDAFLNNTKVDFNKDNFRDLPTGNLFTALNRWSYNDGKGLIGQVGVRVLMDKKIGGETDFNPSLHKFSTHHYGLGIETNRFEIFSKLGYVFPEKRFKSIGLQLSTFRHDQQSYFGITSYDALQKNIYANLIYQSIISNTNHKFRTGLSFSTDNYDEKFKNINYKRTENVPGVFFEYTYSYLKKLDIILGVRGDHNSLFGTFITPRFHLRYEPVSGSVLRVSAGRGQRTANIFAENTGVLVSSRLINILNFQAGKAYGLNPEIAWSEGFGFDQRFRLFNRNGSLGIDFFRTDFQNQVIVDLDKSTRQVDFYNLSGKSYANSFQTELSYELLRKLDIKLAYRLFDVKATYNNQLMERPLIAKHRGFLNLAYEIKSWKFDYTVTYNGTKRIPYTKDNPLNYQMAERSPSYIIMNGQISTSIGKDKPFDIYLGAENIGNYFQKQVIIASDRPFTQYFDASLIWGPVSGRMIYAGVRYKLK